MSNPFDQFDSQTGNPFDQFDEKPFLDQTEDPSIAADVAKGGLSGVGRGVASMPGFAGDVQSIARMAPWAPKRSLLDAILEKTTGNKNLPTSEDTVNAAAKVIPGINYKPQTGAGELSQRVGEFLPNALGGQGGVVSKVIKNAVLPATGSLMAEKAAEGTGYEPIASALGAVAGGALPSAKNLLPRIGLTQDAKIARDVSNLERAGVKMSAGDHLGNSRLQWLEDAADKMPGARDVRGEKLNTLNRAYFKQAGVDAFLDAETGQFNPDTWIQGDARFKGLYDNINKNSFVDYNPTTGARLRNIESNYHNWTNATGPVKGVTNWFEKIRDIGVNGGRLSGDDAQAWRSELVSIRKGLSPKTAEYTAIDGLVKLIDDSLEANTPAKYKNLRNQINRQYSNYKLLEEAAGTSGSSTGYISSANLRNKATRRNNYAMQRGTSDLGELARSAENVMKVKPSSGTAERATNMAILGGNLGYANAAVGAGLGRIITSDFVQRLLKNGINANKTPIDKEAIIRSGILGLLSGSQ